MEEHSNLENELGDSSTDAPEQTKRYRRRRRHRGGTNVNRPEEEEQKQVE